MGLRFLLDCDLGAYLFDFLGTADPRREREVEQALVDHVQRFLLELGAGFAFVGRRAAKPGKGKRGKAGK